MYKVVVGVLFSISTLMAYSMPKEENKGLAYVFVDDEYNLFRKQGDELYKAGQYEKALKKYLSCLEVPGFERDVYAIGRIENCQRAIELKAEVMKSLDTTLETLNKSSSSDSKNVFIKDSLFIGQLERVFTSFQTILKLNPEDASMRELAFTYWSSKGNQAMNAKNWERAKEWFEKALEYKFDGATDRKLARSIKMLADSQVVNEVEPTVLERVVAKPVEDTPQRFKIVDNTNTDEEIKKEVGKVSSSNNAEKSIGVVTDEVVDGDVVRPPRKKEPLFTQPITVSPLQIGLGGVAVVGFVTAISLNSGWQNRLEAIERNVASVNRAAYLNAYQDAVDYQSKVGVRNTSLILSFAALGVDAYLFVRQQKPSKVSVRTEGIGINIQVKF